MAKEAAKKTAKKTTAKKTAVKKVTKKKAPLSSDFAVIETGGKQYTVSVGDIIEVELIGEFQEGDKIEFDKVLLSDDGQNATIGTPYIAGAKVKATFIAETKGKKLIVFRYKAKSNRDKKVGHRQHYAQVEINAI